MLSTKTKIIIAVIAIVLTVTGVTLWLTLYRPFDDSLKNVTVVLVDEFTGYEQTYTVRTECSTLADLIEEKEEWKVVYEITPPPVGYGMFIQGLNGVTAPNGKYVSVLSNYNDTKGELLDTTSDYSQSYKVSSGTICYSTMKGASEFPLADGYYYVIILFK